MMYRTSVTFIPMIVHLFIIKPPRNSTPHSIYATPKITDYIKAPNSTGIINVGASATLQSINDSIHSMAELNKLNIDVIRGNGLWSDGSPVRLELAMSWECAGLPDTCLVCDQDVKGALELLEIRGWKGHLVVMCVW